MVGLHERPLLLILRLELRQLLLQCERAFGDVGRRSCRQRPSIGAFGGHSACSRIGKRLVELLQRLTLKRVGVAAALAVGSRGIDDALLLRISDQRPLGMLEVAAGLVDLPLEPLGPRARRAPPLR